MYTKPIISFILPGYNVERYIAECIESILRQPIGAIEIIYVDDKSTDKTLQVCELIAQKDERIKVIQHAENRGSYAARNTGIEHAIGEWVIFLDPDDLLSPNFYSSVRRALEDTECDLLTYDYEAFNDGEAIPLADFKGTLQPISRTENLRRKAFTWLKLIRLTFLREAGVKFYEGKTMWDILFHWQIVLACKSPLYLNEKLLWYRQRPSASSYRVDWYRAEGFKVMDKLRESLNADGRMMELQKIFYQQELNLYSDIRWAFFSNPVLEKQADGEIKKRVTTAHWELILNASPIDAKKRDYLLTCCRPSSAVWTPRLILPAIRYYAFRFARALKNRFKSQ